MEETETKRPPTKAETVRAGSDLRSSFSPERWSAIFEGRSPGSWIKILLRLPNSKKEPVAFAARNSSYSGGGRVGIKPTSLFHPEPFDSRTPSKKRVEKEQTALISKNIVAIKPFVFHDAGDLLCFQEDPCSLLGHD